MPPHRISILLAALLAPAAFAATCGAHGTKDTMLVTTEWLAGHLNDPNLVLLAIGDKAEYDKAHIPGAQFLPGDEFSTPMQDGQLMLELPPVDQLQKAFSSHGITNNSRIVLYMTRGTISPATRAYLTFDAVGLGAQTSILDAGFSVWKGEGRAVTDQVKAPKPGKLDLCLRDDVIASADYVHSNVRRQGVAIVDARLARFYAGEAAGRNHDGSSQRAG